MIDMGSYIEKLQSSRFTKSINTAFIVVLIVLFILNFSLPFLVDLPAIQVWVLKGVKLVAVVLLVLAILHLFPLFKHINNVKNGAPLFPVSQSIKRYRPWPAHSHPIARKAGWGPVEQKNEVYGKKTRLVIVSKMLLKQKPGILRIVMVVFMFLTGVSLGLFPIVTASLVYEITPPEIAALQRVASEMQMLFFSISIILLAAAMISFCSQIRLAAFDRSGGKCHITTSRCFGLLDRFLKPERIVFNAVDVAGLQIAHHVTKNLKRNKRRIDQYELIVVLSDTSRHMLTKGSRHKNILNDAIKLAKFMGVPVWDRSNNYQADLPSIVSPVDPVVQSL